MTRDQAITAFNAIPNAHSSGAEAWIDRFVALGIITLDPPKNPVTPMEKLEHALRKKYLKDGDMVSLTASLEELGLEVVVKTKR